MNDLGLYGDSVADDGWYSSQVVFQGANLAYYVYAENDSAGAFLPSSAAYEYYTIKGSLVVGDIVINELMASTTSTIQDTNNEFDDWIELYNTSNNSISLSGLYLSDEWFNLAKWSFPDIIVLPNNYVVLWADSDESQSGIHASFKLASEGEQLFLSDASGLILDSVTFTNQLEDISFGRFQNGIGDFELLSPTFNATNNTATIIPVNNQLVLKIYPNPVNEMLFVNIESQGETTVQIVDVLGRIIYSQNTSAGIFNLNIPTKEYVSGVYHISVHSEDFVTTQKFVKL